MATGSRYIRDEFTETPAGLVPPLPFVFENALMVNFNVPADMNKLQEYCNKSMSAPSGYAVDLQVLLPMVTICYVYYPKAYSSSVDPSISGYLTYKECLVLIPVIRKGCLFLGMDSIFCYLPFLFLDQPRAVVAGREVFGMSKVSAHVNFPNGISDPNEFSCETLAIPHPRARISVAQTSKLLTVKCPRGFSFDRLMGVKLKGMDMAVRNLHRQNSGPMGMTLDMANQIIRINQLNYIARDRIKDSRNPAHVLSDTILTYTPKNISMLYGGSLTGTFIPDYSNEPGMFPISKVLGLKNEITGASWVRMTFNLTDGENLWNRTSR